MTVQPTLQDEVPPDFTALLTALGLEVRKQINCVRIGIVQSFNAAKQIANVQIAQNQITVISPVGVRTLAPFPILANIPVFFPCGGGYTLTFPIKQGDECIVLFNDRELDNWLMAGGTNTTPTMLRMHDIADGICLVGLRSYTRSLGGFSTSSTQLRSDDGLTSVDINGTGEIVTINAPAQINLNSPVVTVQGIINVVNENNVANPCTIAGSIQATGDIVADVLGAPISLVNHVHLNGGGIGNSGAATG